MAPQDGPTEAIITRRQIVLAKAQAKRANIPFQDVRGVLLDDTLFRLISLVGGMTERQLRRDPDLKKHGIGDRAVRGALSRLRAKKLVWGRRTGQGKRSPVRLYARRERKGPDSTVGVLPDLGNRQFRIRGSKRRDLAEAVRQLLTASAHAKGCRDGLRFMGPLAKAAVLDDGRSLVPSLDKAAGQADRQLAFIARHDVLAFEEGWRSFLNKGPLVIEVDAPAKPA